MDAEALACPANSMTSFPCFVIVIISGIPSKTLELLGEMTARLAERAKNRILKIPCSFPCIQGIQDEAIQRGRISDGACRTRPAGTRSRRSRSSGQVDGDPEPPPVIRGSQRRR